MEMLQGVWKHLRPRAVVGYGVKIFLPSPPNYVTRSPGSCLCFTKRGLPFVFAPKNAHHRLPEILRWCTCGTDRPGGVGIRSRDCQISSDG